MANNTINGGVTIAGEWLHKLLDEYRRKGAHQERKCGIRRVAATSGSDFLQFAVPGKIAEIPH